MGFTDSEGEFELTIDEPGPQELIAAHSTVGRAVLNVTAPADNLVIRLDPMARSSFTVECDFDEAYQTQLGRPMQYQLHYVLSHYHGLGAYSQLEIAGGPRDGEVIMRHDGFGENLGVPIDPPLDLAAAGATGLRFTCGYQNPRLAQVGWGIGDQEMCVVALQAKTDIGWDGDVKRNTGTRVGADPSGAHRARAASRDAHRVARGGQDVHRVEPGDGRDVADRRGGRRRRRGGPPPAGAAGAAGLVGPDL